MPAAGGYLHIKLSGAATAVWKTLVRRLEIVQRIQPLEDEIQGKEHSLDPATREHCKHLLSIRILNYSMT